MATIFGTNGIDNIVANPEADLIVALAGNDFVEGQGGDDRILGGDGLDALNGQDGNDVLIGGLGNDALFGGDGDDTFIWRNGDGSDFIRGDAGTDKQVVSGALEAGDTFTLGTGAGSQAEFSRENLGLFTLTLETVETMRINGNGGDDSLTVGDLSGTDITQVIFDGGEGNDALLAAGTTTRVVLSGGNGQDFAVGGSANDRLLGGNDVDQLFGGDGDDQIIGGKGNDDIEGGNGNDIAIWNNGDGSDNVLGGAGNDTQRFNMDDGSGDQMTLEAAGGLATFARTNLGQFSVEMQSVERIVVVGNQGDDQLAVDNVEDGGVTALHFSGGAGQDVLTTAAGTSARMIVNGGDGDDQLTTGDGIDVLVGGTGQDNLDGGAGRDRLIGQAGDDTLTGGADRDVFVFTQGDNHDRITDFEDGVDLLRFNGATFTFADLNISDSGADLRIATPDGDSVTLLGLAGTTLTEADFVIVA